MRIIAIVVALLLCTGTFFQVQADCITTTSVTATENQKVNLVNDNGREHYEMFDEETEEYFKAEVIDSDSHGKPIFGFTDEGKAAKEDHESQDLQGGGPGGGGGGGGPH